MSSCKSAIKKVKDVSEATSLVLDWFERENKPVTPQSLTDALGSRVGKPLVQKILEQLLAEEKLCAKDLKKIRFYYLRLQSHDSGEQALSATAALQPEPAAPPEEEQPSSADAGGALSGEEETDAAALDDLAQLAAVMAEEYRRLARWRGWPSQAERAAQRQLLEEEGRQLESQAVSLQVASAADTAAASDTAARARCARRAVLRYRRARHSWLERRGWAMRLLEASGGDLHSPQHMASLLGCTTDNDAGVSFEGAAVPLPPQFLRDIGMT